MSAVKQKPYRWSRVHKEMKSRLRLRQPRPGTTAFRHSEPIFRRCRTWSLIPTPTCSRRYSMATDRRFCGKPCWSPITMRITLVSWWSFGGVWEHGPAIPVERTVSCKLSALATERRTAPGSFTIRVRHSATWKSPVSPSREEALTKMRNELQYRLELCPCSGESVGTVELQVSEDFSSGQTARTQDAK